MNCFQIKMTMEQIKTIKTTPAEMCETLNGQTKKHETAEIVVPLETGQTIRLYYYGNCEKVIGAYYNANDDLEIKTQPQPPEKILHLAAVWVCRALRLWGTYLNAPQLVNYDEKNLGRYEVHARDTKHGLKYDVVRMIGFKRVQPLRARWLPRHVFRFQRYFTTDYRGACAIAEYLNAKQNKSPSLSCCEVVKKYGGEKITLCWVGGSSINDENFNEKFNAEIYRPEFRHFYIQNELYK